MQSSQSVVIIILCCENKRFVNGNLAILKKLLVYFSQQFAHFSISNMYYPLYLQFKKLEIIRNRDLLDGTIPVFQTCTLHICQQLIFCHN